MEMKQFTPNEQVEVLTYGLCETWNEAKYVGHSEATPTTNELFYFNGSRGCYPVKAEDLASRVRTARLSR